MVSCADTIIGGVGISWVVTAHTHTELGSSQQQFSPFSTSPRPQTQSRAAQQLGPPAPQGCRKLPSTVHTLFLFWGPNHHERCEVNTLQPVRKKSPSSRPTRGAYPMHLLHRPATSRHVLHACIRNAPSRSPFPKAHRLGLRLPDVLLGTARSIGFTASQPVGPSPNNVLKAPGWGLPLADNVLGTVTELYADAGSHVFADETIAVIETDKLAVDVKATQTGMISERLVSVGEDVKIFQPMYAIDVDSEPPPAGSEAWQKARTWTGLHAQRVDEERAEAERLWREHQERQKAASGGGSSEWRWQSTAREFRHEQQDGPQDFRHRQYRHHHPRGHQWRQPRSPSWSASNASGRRQQPQPSADVLAMPLKELVPHVLRYHASDPLLCLGLRPGASSAAIRKRYLALAMKMHPDRAKEAHPQLNEAFGHMGSAFNTLRGRR